jgi:hypothetical protein
VGLEEDIERIAALVARSVDALLTAVLAAEPEAGTRSYLCSFGENGERTWLVVDDQGLPVVDRSRVRDTVTIAALCEIAVDVAFPGDIDELRGRLVQLRLTEAPDGIEEAEAAALALQRLLGAPPQLASPARLDEIGLGTRRLERALDPTAPSPSSAAMQAAAGSVEELLAHVQASYRVPLDG